MPNSYQPVIEECGSVRDYVQEKDVFVGHLAAGLSGSSADTSGGDPTGTDGCSISGSGDSDAVRY